MQVCPYLPCGPIVSTFCPSSSARWTQGGGRCGLEWIKVEAGGHNCQGQIEAAPFLIWPTTRKDTSGLPGDYPVGSRPIFLEPFMFRYFIKCWANLSNEYFVANFRMFQNSFLLFAFLLLPCAFASSPIRFSIIVTIITDTHTEFPKTF